MNGPRNKVRFSVALLFQLKTRTPHLILPDARGPSVGGGAFLLFREQFLVKEPFGDGDPIGCSRHQGIFVEGVAGVVVHL